MLETVPPAPIPALPREPRGSGTADPTAAPTGQSCAHSPGAPRHRSYARPPAAAGDARAAVRVTFVRTLHSPGSREGSAAATPGGTAAEGGFRGSAVHDSRRAWGRPCRRTGLSSPGRLTSDGVARPETHSSSQGHAVPLQDVLKEGHGGGHPGFSRGIGERSGASSPSPTTRTPTSTVLLWYNALKARSWGHRRRGSRQEQPSRSREAGRSSAPYPAGAGTAPQDGRGEFSPRSSLQLLKTGRPPSYMWTLMVAPAPTVFREPFLVTV